MPMVIKKASGQDPTHQAPPVSEPSKLTQPAKQAASKKKAAKKAAKKSKATPKTEPKKVPVKVQKPDPPKTPASVPVKHEPAKDAIATSGMGNVTVEMPFFKETEQFVVGKDKDGKERWFAKNDESISGDVVVKDGAQMLIVCVPKDRAAKMGYAT